MNRKEDSARKIIVALDVASREKALSLIRRLEGVEIFKVGVKLFTAEGPPLLREIRELGKKVFLDLKLHDIPNTVAETIRVAVRFGVHMLTLHSCGGREMMESAVNSAASEAEKEGTDKPLLLAVTVLTSLKREDLLEIGMAADTLAQVLRLANLARGAGVDGLVCSPQEIEIVKKEIGKDLLVVVPGIRPSWASAQDQKRIMTPSQAIQKGADYLVIGRPIIEDPSPQKAFLRIVEELNHAGDSADNKNCV